MKILITDAATVCGNGIDLDCISKFGEVAAYDFTTSQQLLERIADADMLLCNKTVVTREAIESAPNLKYIGLFATGYNNIDLDAAKERGVRVCNAGSYSTEAVAQLTFAFLLNHFCRLADYSEYTKDGGWKKSSVFSPILYPTSELNGKTIGLVGYGAIGKSVAKIADAFGMKVLASVRTPRKLEGAESVSFDELLKLSDIVSVHCPLTEQTAGMFDEAAFAAMKPGSFFINTARGPIVDEFALLKALESGHLAGAALDVLRAEPMAEDCPLLGAKNLVITPHTAWTPLETRSRLLSIVCSNIEAFLRGDSANVIV